MYYIADMHNVMYISIGALLDGILDGSFVR